MDAKTITVKTPGACCSRPRGRVLGKTFEIKKCSYAWLTKKKTEKNNIEITYTMEEQMLVTF